MSARRSQDLYERELQTYRELLASDKEQALSRYGMTLINSLNPAERAGALKGWGVEITEPLDHYNLGVQAAREENWSEAIVHFKKAIELDPTLTEAIYNLALCFEKTGHVPQAKSTWDIYIKAVGSDDETRRIKQHLADLDEG